MGAKPIFAPRRIVCALALLLAFGCRSKDVAPSPKAGAPAPGAATAGAVDLGAVDLTFAGAFTHQVKGQGVGLADDDVTHTVHSLDVQRMDPSPYWSLSVSSEDGEPWALLVLYETRGSADDPRRFEFARGTIDRADGVYRLDATLKGKSGEVQLTGTIRGPAWPARGSQHAAVMSTLRDNGFADVRPFAIVGQTQERRIEALISVVVSRQAARDELRRVRESLPAGWAAFVGERNPRSETQQIVCAPISHPLDVLAWARTAPPNVEFATASIRRKLEEWSRATPIDVVEASTDSVTVRLVRPPKDVIPLAREAHAFAPDVGEYLLEPLHDVDKLANLYKTDRAKFDSLCVSAIADRIIKHGEIYLWWD